MSHARSPDLLWTPSAVIDRQARTTPDKVFVRMISTGETFTYAEAQKQSGQVATFLHDQGVAPGDRVACYMLSSLDYVRVWLGAARLGATLVPLNLDLTGRLLEYQLDACKASVVIVDSASREAMEHSAPRLQHVRRLIVCDPAPEPSRAIDAVPFDGWRQKSPWAGEETQGSDIGCIIYTSGTTGPSKGVLMPHAHCYIFALGSVEHARLTAQDIVYLFLPLFHVNGLFMQLYAAAIAGASVVMRARFSVSAFLPDAIEHKATISSLLGSIASYLETQPPSPDDRRHQLRLVHQTPKLPALERMWQERFGVPDVITGYGMTEVNLCVWSSPRGTPPGACGRAYEDFFELRIVNPQTDVELPCGEVGEIVVRPRHPFGFMAGYDGMPEATVAAWRNLWFHTGDAGRIDAQGYLYFVDRMKDCIRRGGENISSYEVEQAFAGYPGVQEVAAYPVAADAGGEDEVMVAVVPVPGAQIDLAQLHAAVCGALPRFAHPRYLELFDALPKTGTAKIRKVELRRRGVGEHTFDARVHAGAPRREPA